MSQTTVPTSKAKTAYGLLSDVRRVILEEPKRYNQSEWITRFEPRHAAAYEWIPACGTIGCVGGWTAVLGSRDGVQGNIRMTATLILGLNLEQASELFSAAAVGRSLGIGTEQYAKAGARHIHNFQRKHAKQLKATKVSR